MTQRNYACDAGIRKFMGNATALRILYGTGEHELKAQTYLCQLVQALDQKSAIEGRRGANQFGALVWMLNEIWPTIGWGSLEYGSQGFTPGQVSGGRWKPMHYFYKSSLMQDVMATCGLKYHGHDEWVCYIKNDGVKAFAGKVTLLGYSLLGDGTPTTVLEQDVNMQPGTLLPTLTANSTGIFNFRED